MLYSNSLILLFKRFYHAMSNAAFTQKYNINAPMAAFNLRDISINFHIHAKNK